MVLYRFRWTNTVKASVRRRKNSTWLPVIETHWMSYSRDRSTFRYPILCYVPFHSRKREKERMGEGRISQMLQEGERKY